MIILDLKETVYQTIEEIKTNNNPVTLNSLFKEDLGIDSIKGFKLMMSLEKKNIVFKNVQITSLNTVKELIDVLEFKNE